MISRFVVISRTFPFQLASYVLGGLAMMFGGLVIVLRCLFVMLMNFVLCHSRDKRSTAH